MLYYLLQLVQVLRYDKDKIDGKSELGNFLIEGAVSNPIMANYLYWYLRVECHDINYRDFYETKLKEFLASLNKVNKIYFENKKLIKIFSLIFSLE